MTWAKVIAAVVLVSAGCGSGADSGETPGQAGDPSIGLAIEQVLTDQVEAWNRGDLEAFMEGYWRSPDLLFTSSGVVRRGWQTTIERYRATYGEAPETMGHLVFSNLSVSPLGDDAAWALGKWELHRSEGDLGGVFTLVFRRIDGRWVIVHDHTSVSPPD